MTFPAPPAPVASRPPPDTAEFSQGSVGKAALAGCALPVVGVLLAFLLGLGLIVWSGARADDRAEDTIEDAAPAARADVPQVSDTGGRADR